VVEEPRIQDSVAENVSVICLSAYEMREPRCGLSALVVVVKNKGSSRVDPAAENVSLVSQSVCVYVK
jgi:hypothetical protein